MVYFEQHVILVPETEVRMDMFLQQFDRFFQLIKPLQVLGDETQVTLTMFLQQFENFLQSMNAFRYQAAQAAQAAQFFTKVFTPAEIIRFERATKNIAGTMASVERTMGNVESITRHIDRVVFWVYVLVVVLVLSVVLNMVLVWSWVRGKKGKGRVIEVKGDGKKRA
jgi:hypothetical protein